MESVARMDFPTLHRGVAAEAAEQRRRGRGGMAAVASKVTKHIRLPDGMGLLTRIP